MIRFDVTHDNQMGMTLKKSEILFLSCNVRNPNRSAHSFFFSNAMGCYRAFSPPLYEINDPTNRFSVSFYRFMKKYQKIHTINARKCMCIVLSRTFLAFDRKNGQR